MKKELLEDADIEPLRVIFDCASLSYARQLGRLKNGLTGDVPLIYLPGGIP